MMLLPIVAAFFAAALQEKPVVLDIKPHWAAGDVFWFERVKEKSDSSDGVKTVKSASATPLRLDVVSAGPEGSVVRWTWGSTRVTTIPPDLEKMPAELRDVISRTGSISDGASFEMKVDPDGRLTELANPERAAQQLQQGVGAVTKQLERVGAANEGAQAVLASLRAMVQQPDQLLSALVKDPAILHCAIGRQLVEGKELESDTEIPNPFDGKPLPAKRRTRMDGVDLDKQVARLRLLQEIDPDKAADVARAFLDRDPRSSAKSSLQLRQFIIREEIAAVVDLKSGLPWEIESARTTEVLGQGRIETTRFKRLAGPPPESKPAK